MLVIGWALASLTVISDPDLDALVGSVVKRAVVEYAPHALRPEDLGVVVLNIASGEIRQGSHLGDQSFYPASVVKLFYLAYAGQRIAAKKLKETSELRRALTDMIVDSSNDATNWILEAITGATSGPELGPAELKKWRHRREAVNRYFVPRGYPGLNASQKTWDWGPYGRERQGYGLKYEFRNAMSPAHAARLLAELALGSVPAAQWSLAFLRRTIPADDPKAGSQAASFVGKVLAAGSKLWSKAGWTSDVRHDAALFELPNGHRYVFAIFTRNQSGQGALVADVARWLLESLGEETRREAHG